MPDAIVVPTAELDLDRVLMSGQTFRWDRDAEGWWIAPIGGAGDVLRVVRRGGRVLYESRGIAPQLLASDYFNMNISVRKLQDEWGGNGAGELSAEFSGAPGLRIVRQDPVECLISFLCSSAAPIHRIRRSVTGLCELLGDDLGEWHGRALRSFPTLERLASVQRLELDRLGLGFRGRYVNEAARQSLEQGGRAWLLGLRSSTYVEAKAALMRLPGVGEKVADCVCLFSLDKHESVPIDVHMARVAKRHFEECVSLSTVNKRSYAVASECFRRRYGAYAGWAQQYLFFAEIERRGLWDQQINKHRPRQTAP